MALDALVGLSALRKTIELVLQKLNMVQDEMNELSREELLEIMANENLDLSWIASQESVDAIRKEVQNLSKIVNAINKNTMRTIGYSEDYSYFDYECKSGSVLLYNTKNQPSGDLVIFPTYEVSGTKYSTKIGRRYGSNQQILLSNINSIYVQDGVVFSGEYYTSDLDVVLSFKSNTKIDTVHIGKVNCNKQKYWNEIFDGCTSLTNVIIESFALTEVGSTAKYVFRNCRSLSSLDLSNVDLSMVTNATGMFQGCTNLKEILVSRNKWIPASCNTTDMFKDCGVDHVTYV